MRDPQLNGLKRNIVSVNDKMADHAQVREEYKKETAKFESMTEKSKWHQLWFAFGVYLVVGAVALQAGFFATVYFVNQLDVLSHLTFSLIAVFMVLSLFHAVSALPMVWVSSRNSKKNISIVTRTIAIVYTLITITVIFTFIYTYATLPS